MPRKKSEVITGLASEDKLLVQKSLPLFALWRSDLTLPEFKILDTYLSRIDSRKPEKRTVLFGRGELEHILGVVKINHSDLKERLKHLMCTVEIPDPGFKKGFRLVNLFEEAVAEQDGDGLWQVKLECSQKAMKYFFNVENLGYLRYKLRAITTITSRYSYILFTYIEHNRFRKSWEIELEELKHMLSCDQVETYRAFKEFHKQVLKRAHEELTEKTECRYTYEPIKKGRKVTAIRFTVETLADRIEAYDPNQITIDQWQRSSELWSEPLKEFGFSMEELDEIRAILCTVPPSKLPEDPVTGGNREIQWYHYVDQKAKEIRRRNSQKEIKSPFGYLKKMMQKDALEG